MELVADLRAALTPHADPARAAATRAYLKTEMPMFGLPRPAQKRLFRVVLARHPLVDHAAWEEAVRAVWAEPEREFRYAAIAVVRGSRGKYLTPEAVPLLEQLVREGAWWDLVDEIAAHAVGTVVLRHREAMHPVLERWIDDADQWVRRAALLAQVRHRGETDAAQLFAFCLRRSGDTTFWIRKAIGWALREYASHDPDAVRSFLTEHSARLSGLSRREAAKHLG